MRRVALAVALSGLVASLTLVPISAPAMANGHFAPRDDIGVQQAIAWPSSGTVSRNCATGWSCRVRATGGAGTQTHFKNGAVFNSWSNTSATTRTSFHGSGSQTARITANTSLANPSATCICVVEPCPI